MAGKQQGKTGKHGQDGKRPSAVEDQNEECVGEDQQGAGRRGEPERGERQSGKKGG